MQNNFCNKDHIILWLDNSFSQNKNWLLYWNLIAIINDNNIKINTITLKYLERGHTYNSCDSIYSIISRKLSNELEIYTPNDCINLIKNCSEKIHVIEVLYSDMYLFDDISHYKKPFLLKKVKQFQVRKNSTNCYLKFSHRENDFKEYSLLKHTINENYLRSIPKQTEPNGLTPYVFEELIKLSQYMPSECKTYYNNLKPLVRDKKCDKNKH